MGYIIEYEVQKDSCKNGDTTWLRFRVLTAAFLMVGCMTARTMWQEGCELLQSVFIPGEPTITEAAFLQMMDRLHYGEPVGECITAFCKTIVANDTEKMPEA